jgi:hypothetical protein
MYRWTKPNNTLILSANSDSSSIVLKFNTGYTGGSITVKGQTACGALGTAKTQALTHSSCPTGTRQQYVSKGLVLTDEIVVSPNPTQSSWSLRIPAVSDNMKIVIRDVQGRVVGSIDLSHQQYISFGSELRPGVYFAEITTGQIQKKIRLLKY